VHNQGENLGVGFSGVARNFQWGVVFFA
jgi:hypothetical protein